MILPDLTNLNSVEAWEHERRAAGATEFDLRAAYENDGSPLALLRCAACLGGGKDEPERQRAYVEQARRATTNRIEQLFADALLGFAYIVRGRVHGRTDLAGARAVVPMLERGLRAVRGLPDRGVLGGEVEYRFLHTLGYAHFLLDEPEFALEYASESLTTAFALGSSKAETRAKALYALALTASDRLHDALLWREEALNDVLVPRDRFNHLMQASQLLYTLGNLHAALDTLDAAEGYGLNEPERRARRQELLLVMGIGGLEPIEEDYKGAANNAWAAHALQALLRSRGLPPIRSHDEERRTLLRSALLICERHGVERMRYGRLFEQWVRGVAHFWGGEAGRAEVEASRDTPPRESLLTRGLLAALRLESALQVGVVSFSPLVDLESELRSVFELAAQLGRASANALAEAVSFWHPLAAAYAAVMPEPIVLFRSALDGVVRINGQHVAHGVVLPPMVVAERMLLDLGVRIAPPDLNPAMRRQRDALKTVRGDVPVWRTFTSGAHLAYGLTKAAENAPDRQAYEVAARNVVADFGLLPTLRTDYAAAELHELDAALRALLRGERTAREFAQQLHAL